MTTETTNKRRAWSLKKRWAILGGIPLALVALPAAAAVIIAALAGITGGGSTGTYTAKFAQTTPVADYSTLVVKPGAPSISNGKLKLGDGLVMFPGESFTIRASVTDAGSTAPGFVSGITMPGMPSGYTAELTQGCGGNFPLYDTQEVTIKITASATQTPGQSWTLSPEAGVQVSVGDKPAAPTCTVYTAP